MSVLPVKVCSRTFELKRLTIIFFVHSSQRVTLFKQKGSCLRVGVISQVTFSNSFSETLLKRLVRTLQCFHDKLLTRAHISFIEEFIIFLKSASNKFHIIIIIIITIIVKELPLHIKELYH